MNAHKIGRHLALIGLAGVVITLLGWAFMAYRHPDRVGDFASFIQMCGSALMRR